MALSTEIFPPIGAPPRLIEKMVSPIRSVAGSFGPSCVDHFPWSSTGAAFAGGVAGAVVDAVAPETVAAGVLGEATAPIGTLDGLVAGAAQPTMTALTTIARSAAIGLSCEVIGESFRVPCADGAAAMVLSQCARSHAPVAARFNVDGLSVERFPIGRRASDALRRD